MTNRDKRTKIIQQNNRVKAARALLSGSNCGDLIIAGKKVSVKMLPCGSLVGVGKKFADVRIDPINMLSSDPVK